MWQSTDDTGEHTEWYVLLNPIPEFAESIRFAVCMVRDKEMLMRRNLEFGDLILVEALCRLTLPTLSEAFLYHQPS